MPAPGSTPPPRRAPEPETRRAIGLNPATGEEIELPRWGSKALYVLKSRTTLTLIMLAFTFFGSRIGFQPEEAEMRQLLDHSADILMGVLTALGIIFSIRRRWTPPEKR